MRRFIAIGAFVGLAVWVLAQVSGSDMIANFAKTLNGAKSLSATYSVQRIGGESASYKLDLAKPNKARIDSPAEIIVADGTTITVYDKGDNSYYKKPQTDAELKALFNSDQLNMFGSFFDAEFYKDRVIAAKQAGQKVRKGVTYNVVTANLDNKGKKTMSFYLDPADKLAKVGEYVLNDAGATDTVLVLTKEYTIDGSPNANLFAFAPPTDSKQVSLEEMNAGKWYEDFAEAQAMAKKANKPIFLDFYADW